jgi:deazaflavin-dependent oxidoreductase (nitroreductase family)
VRATLGFRSCCAGSFEPSGFFMALTSEQQGRHADAIGWFERHKAACGPPGLFTEEFDIRQRQLRGNIPQAFVHAPMFEMRRPPRAVRPGLLGIKIDCERVSVPAGPTIRALPARRRYEGRQADHDGQAPDGHVVEAPRHPNRQLLKVSRHEVNTGGVTTNGRVRARPAGFQRLGYRLPIGLYRAGLGGLLGQRFVLIHHLGRNSGQWRQVVVEVAERDPVGGSVTVMSGFGTASDWYRNLLAHPGARIQLGSHSVDVHAVPLTEGEAADVLERYARRHPLAARGMLRALGISVDGSSAGYRAAGRQIPAIRLQPGS